MRSFSLILAFYFVSSGALFAALPDPNAPAPSSSKGGVDVKGLNDSKDLGPDTNKTGTVDPKAAAPYTTIPSHGAATADPAAADGTKDEALFQLKKPIRLIDFNEKNFLGRVGIIFLQPFEDIISALINQIGTDMTIGGFHNVGWLSPIEAKRARDKALADIQKNAETAVTTPADCAACKAAGQMTPTNPNSVKNVFYRNGTQPSAAAPPKT